MNHPPGKYQSTFWSVKISDLDLAKDKPYIINQALAYGDLEVLRWLFRTYDKQTIREVFLKQPIKIYTPQIFYLSKLLLKVPDDQAPAYRYDRSLPRHLG